jgi:hypothetical protein
MPLFCCFLAILLIVSWEFAGYPTHAEIALTDAPTFLIDCLDIGLS